MLPGHRRKWTLTFFLAQPREGTTFFTLQLEINMVHEWVQIRFTEVSLSLHYKTMKNGRLPLSYKRMASNFY